ncbi:ABC transporter ATP-binding protein [Proteinivorax hydrogeniformans]|uniref:ABC transporter ATP-binding protein n=1 Tax=Proteinivorax hydrogeniformans TaxID=1826727 RepID=A0AAU8HUM9_9FIRM
MMNLDVVFSGISLKYGDFEALKDISFSLMPGKIYGLVGRNGAGKTSLLSLMASFRTPSQGFIKIGGEEPFENSRVMPQVSFVYDSDYSVEEWSAMGYFEFAQLYRPDFDLEYAKKLAKRFKLPLDKPINKLSKGMQSSLNAILGLANRSALTIFDEVYLGMDAPTREQFYNEVIEEQSRNPRIMILSTHLVSEMEYLFDHVLILDKGSLIVDGPYDEVVSRGASITGNEVKVDRFVKGMNVLRTQKLGNTKSATVYGEIDEKERMEAQKQGLEIGSVSLQDLFIYLTKEEDSYESTNQLHKR